MSKRIHIVLPDRTLKVLDRVAGKRGRSRYISEAVRFYVQTQAFSDLRRRLDQGISAGRLPLD
jgi:metal-responsive CopG/Arc/MetJ family transcriptional regulator